MDTVTDYAFEQWTPEAIDARLAELSERFAPEEPLPNSPDALAQAFEYAHLLLYDRRVHTASEHLARLEEHLDAALAQEPEAEALLMRKIDWLQLAMGFAGFSKTEYAELPFFQEIMTLTEGRKGLFAARRAQAIIGAVQNYRVWLHQGGAPENLAPEDREWLNAQYVGLDATVTQVADDLAAQGHPQYRLAVLRTLGRFWFQNGEPDKGLALMNQVKADLPHLPNYAETDVADIEMEMAQLLMLVARNDAARFALASALAIYEAAGEDFELLAMQAETWLAELDD